MFASVISVSELLATVVSSGLIARDVSALRTVSSEFKQCVERSPIDVPHSVVRDGPTMTLVTRFTKGIAAAKEIVSTNRRFESSYPILACSLDEAGTGCIVAYDDATQSTIAVPVFKGMCRKFIRCGCRQSNYSQVVAAKPLPVWTFLTLYARWYNYINDSVKFDTSSISPMPQALESAFGYSGNNTVASIMSSEVVMKILTDEAAAACDSA